MTANTRIHRFDFGGLRDFRGPIIMETTLPDAAAAEPEAPPAPTFSEQDLESARLAGKKQGYTEGFTAGKQEAARDADRKAEDANQVIASIGGQISGLTGRYQQLLESEAQYLSSLVLSAAKKVAGEAIDKRGEEIILSIVARCLPVIFSKPRLIIELNPDVFERTVERIKVYLNDNGFEGEIQFKANPSLGLSDARLDWGTGQVNHSAEALWKEIEGLIERIPLELTFNETLAGNQEITGE